MRSIVISIKSICFSYGWIQLLKLVSLLPVQFSNKRIICSNRKKVLHMLFIRNLYVFRPTVYTTRYQMKDMDIIFLLIPFSLLWLDWFGYYSLSKSSIFSKCSKMLEIDSFYSALNLNFLVIFFKRLSFKDELRFLHETKSI